MDWNELYPPIDYGCWDYIGASNVVLDGTKISNGALTVNEWYGKCVACKKYLRKNEVFFRLSYDGKFEIVCYKHWLE